MSKRASGEGSIYQRADGKWVAVVTLGRVGGVLKRRKVIASTEREALARMKELRARIEEGSTVHSDKLTVGAWLLEWLEKEARPSVRPRTFEGYRQIVIQHLVPALGHHKLRSLEARHVRDFMAAKATAPGATKGKAKAGLSARTIQLMHAVLRRALRRAESYRLVPKNVAMLVSPPPVKRQERAPLTPEQSGEFLRSVKGHRLAPLFTVAMATGLRQSELLALQWADVGFEAGTIRVERSLQRYGRTYHLDGVKTERSRRTIAIPAPVVDVLRQQSTAAKADRLKAGKLWTGETWKLVFATEAGGPLSGVSVTHAFQDALRRAGLPTIRFHDLRHGAASYLLAAGVDLRTVMEILGHADIATTANLYSHVLPQLKRAAADKMAGMLFEPVATAVAT
jgi:integrase